jgi:hypothetical protein
LPIYNLGTFGCVVKRDCLDQHVKANMSGFFKLFAGQESTQKVAEASSTKGPEPKKNGGGHGLVSDEVMESPTAEEVQTFRPPCMANAPRAPPQWMTSPFDLESALSDDLEQPEHGENIAIGHDADLLAQVKVANDTEEPTSDLLAELTSFELSPRVTNALQKFMPKLHQELDFDANPSQLYLLLQQRNWDGAVQRIETHREETTHWVSRKEVDGKLRWRLLPIHGAIIFAAPLNVLAALIKAYPDGVSARDDQGKFDGFCQAFT